MSRTETVLAVVQCGTQICLVRRSQRVATARGLWSVVTGYLEPGTDPLDQARLEIEEELGMPAASVALVRQLEPVPLCSPSSGKAFLVHPFLFRCDSADGVVLNWENDDVQWVEPSRLQAPDCVGWQCPVVLQLLQPSP